MEEINNDQSIGKASRKYGVHEQTIHRWLSRYDGMEESDIRWLKELGDENRRLQKLVAQQGFETMSERTAVNKW
jgi:putative transposase